MVGSEPPTQKEFAKTQQNQILQLPGSWETIRSVAGSVCDVVRFGLPDDYFQKLPEKIRTMSLEDVIHAAQSTLKPDGVTWVIVGDRAQIEPGLKALGFSTRLWTPMAIFWNKPSKKAL